MELTLYLVNYFWISIILWAKWIVASIQDPKFAVAAAPVAAASSAAPAAAAAEEEKKAEPEEESDDDMGFSLFD